MSSVTGEATLTVARRFVVTDPQNPNAPPQTQEVVVATRVQVTQGNGVKTVYSYDPNTHSVLSARPASGFELRTSGFFEGLSARTTLISVSSSDYFPFFRFLLPQLMTELASRRA